MMNRSDFETVLRVRGCLWSVHSCPRLSYDETHWLPGVDSRFTALVRSNYYESSWVVVVNEDGGWQFDDAHSLASFLGGIGVN